VGHGPAYRSQGIDDINVMFKITTLGDIPDFVCLPRFGSTSGDVELLIRVYHNSS
jgi:hypothetical protein